MKRNPWFGAKFTQQNSTIIFLGLVLSLIACLSGAILTELIYLIHPETTGSITTYPTFTLTPIPSITNLSSKTQIPATLTPLGNHPTPLPTYTSNIVSPTPTPNLYSVSIVSKVYGGTNNAVVMNIQAWPPDRSVQLRITYSICAADDSPVTVIIPSWNEYGVAEVSLDASKCWKQGNLLQLSIISYWPSGQQSQLQASESIDW